ncbi:lactadherin-like [Asterias amurensis]|uniref:lactadherin-like n=1 Tax=Asterias amurensis TaxID=7602 RepID=UPI003AB2FB74
MKSGEIPDDNIIASTVDSNFTKASNARLDFKGGWCASDSDPTPWIQVNLNVKVYISTLIIQGFSDNHYVETFSIKYGDSTSSLTYWRTGITTGSIRMMYGNTDGDTHVTEKFWPVLHAQYLRINAESCVMSRCCMRFEVKGCR